MEPPVMANSLSHVPEQIKNIIEQLKQRLEDWYDDRLDRIILYGSYARGDFNEESDIDLLIILKDHEINRMREIQGLVPLKYDLMISNKIWFSLKAITQADYVSRSNAIYHFIRRESITL